MRDVKERSRRQEENREKMDAVPLFQFFDFFSPLDVVDLPAQLFLVSSLFPSTAPKKKRTKKTAALGVLDAAAGLQAAANPAGPSRVPQRRKEKRLKTGGGDHPPRRASGRIAAAGARDYSDARSFRSLFFSSSPPGSSLPGAEAASRGGGPPRVPSSCHSCRQKREEMGAEAEGSSCWRCDGARGRFCRGCRTLRYGLSLEAIKLANERAAAAEEELAKTRAGDEEEEGREGEGDAGEDGDEVGSGRAGEERSSEGEARGGVPAPPGLPSPCGWLCPHCYEDIFGPADGWICNSSLCMKKRAVPLRPTGVAVFEARAAGHASVAHALQARLLSESGNSTRGMVGPRKEGLGCVIEGETDLATVERRRAQEGERRRAAAAAAGLAPPPLPSSPPSSTLPLPSAAAAEMGKENVEGNAAAAKRPRGRPPKSAGAGGGGGARAAAAAAGERAEAVPLLPLSASAALPQPAA